MPAHRRAVHRLDDVIRAEAEPVVLTGDLNLCDRMEGYRVLTAGRLDAMRTTRARSTFFGGWRWRLLMFRIDHCVVPGDWGVADAGTFAIDASDHRGIRARIGPVSTT
jgi:endonuclease/exonuclease/phosphatase family metal-dependent hydrolase